MTADGGNQLTNPGYKEWTFAHVNDSHMGTARSFRFRPAVNKRWAAIKQQIAESKAELLIHGGDLTRDGDIHEFEYQQAKEDLESLPFPCFVIPGNMDVGNKHATKNGAKRKWEEQGLGWNDPDLNVTADRLNLFASWFGPIHWTFVHRDVRFTGFFAAVAGTGLPQEERLWRLLHRLPQLPKTRHHVAMMHYWPFIESLDEPTWNLTDADQYDNWYFSIDLPFRQRLWKCLRAAGVGHLFCGHVHTGRGVQIVDDIRIYRTPAAGNTSQMADRWPDAETRFGFQRCTVTDCDIEVTFVPGNEQCDEFDSYGPMGHPPAELRDYSIARERPALH